MKVQVHTLSNRSGFFYCTPYIAKTKSEGSTNATKLKKWFKTIYGFDDAS